MGAQNETLDLSQSAFHVQLVRVVVRRRRGDMIHTGIVSVLISRYCPTLRSVLSRPSCLLHLRQGTEDFSRPLQVRHPARAIFQFTIRKLGWPYPFEDIP
jgi:hypothetical protein